ncbi:MAG: hypothetical protein IT450_15775 [Phycisphaerales bacterium]|nr:hypothetical protein [Phycisphaerales bacterium]
MPIDLVNELRRLAGQPPARPVRRTAKVPPTLPARAEAAQAACLAVCATCEHAAEAEYGTAACDLVTGCGRSQAPCRERFVRLLLRGRCPAGKWT